MKNFHTLRDFLLLRDDTDRPVLRDYYEPATLVAKYDKAKALWEKYGDTPPFGSKVRTLEAGHGGGPGMIKTLVGIHPTDDRFFRLVDVHDGHFSCSWRKSWWMSFEVVEREGGLTKGKPGG